MPANRTQARISFAFVCLAVSLGLTLALCGAALYCLCTGDARGFLKFILAAMLFGPLPAAGVLGRLGKEP